MLIPTYLKSSNILCLDILQKPVIVISARKTYCSVTVYTVVFLKMNPRVRNMQKTSKIKS